MKKKLVRILGLTLAIVLVLTPAAAVLAYTWEYYTDFSVENTSASDQTAVPVLTTMEVDNLIAAGRADAGAMGVRITEVEDPIHYMLASNKTGLFVPDLLAYQTRNFREYTGYIPDATDFDIITGTDGYITIADDDTLEPGSDFETEQKGYIDTDAGADKNLVYKEDAFRTYIDGATNITSELYHDTSDTIYLYPNAVGDASDIQIIVPDTGEEHWEDVDDLRGAHDDNATYVSSNNSAVTWDYYNLTAPVWLGDVQTITSVKVTYRARHADENATQHATVRLATVNSSDETHVFGAAYSDHTTAALGRPGGGTWVAGDFVDLQVGIGLSDNGLSNPDCTQSYVEIEYTYAFEVTATGVASGEHTVKTVLHNNVFSIQIDEDVPFTTAAVGVTVPDNGNDWILNQNNVMPYMEYFYIWR